MGDHMQRPSQVIMGQPAYLPPIVQPIQSFIFRRPGSQPCKWIMHKCSSIVWCITRGRENQPGWRRIGYSQCKLTVTRHRWSLGVADEVMESYATAMWKAASASMQGCDGTMGRGLLRDLVVKGRSINGRMPKAFENWSVQATAKLQESTLKLRMGFGCAQTSRLFSRKSRVKQICKPRVKKPLSWLQGPFWARISDLFPISLSAALGVKLNQLTFPGEPMLMKDGWKNLVHLA